MTLSRSLLPSDIVQSGPVLLRATIEAFIARLVDKTQTYCMDRPRNEQMYYWLVVDGLGGLDLMMRRWKVISEEWSAENLRLTFVWCTHKPLFAQHQLTFRAPHVFVKQPATRTAAQATALRVWVEEEILTFVRGGAAMFWHLQRQELVGYNQRGLMNFM